MPQPTCSYLLDEWEDDLRDVWRMTEEKNVEHGVNITGDENPVRGPIITGNHDSINISHNTSVFPVDIRIHTHPTPGIGFSKADWRDFLVSIYQTPHDWDYPPHAMRGSCVVGQRFGEDDSFAIRCTYLTEQGFKLTAEEQAELVMDGSDVIDEAFPILGGLDSQMNDLLGDSVETCRETIKL